MYRLFTDVDKNFQCQVDVDGVNLSECKARIVVESKNLNLMFPGIIKENGTCNVPIKRMKALLDEDTTGTIKLEVIADNVLFEAWQSEFVVKTSKKVTIKEVVDDEIEAPIKEKVSTPKVSVKIKEEAKPKPKPAGSKYLKTHLSVLESEIERLNINSVEKFDKLLETYRKIADKKGVITENDIKVIRKKLIKKL